MCDNVVGSCITVAISMDFRSPWVYPKHPWSTRDPWISTRGCGYFATHIHDRYGLEFERGKSMGMGVGQPMDYPCSALSQQQQQQRLNRNPQAAHPTKDSLKCKEISSTTHTKETAKESSRERILRRRSRSVRPTEQVEHSGPITRRPARSKHSQGK